MIRYLVYMDDGSHGNFQVVHQGIESILTTTVTGLTSGIPYRFYVVAQNYVGTSIASSIATMYACDAPTGMPTPLRGVVS